MSRKALCIVDHEPELKALYAKLNDMPGLFKHRIDWVKNAEKKLMEDMEAAHRQCWTSIQDWAKARGLLPDHYDCFSSSGGLGVQAGVLVAKIPGEESPGSEGSEGVLKVPASALKDLFATIFGLKT